MPKQINSFILPDNIIKEMRDKIKETRKVKVELGFSLCKSFDSNIISKGSECTGTKCSLKISNKQCPTNQEYIGNYHTHPRGPPQMSIADMVTACSEDIECIGSVSFNKIRCYTRKSDKEECINEISPFENEEYRILKTDEEIKEELKSPKNVFKPQFIKKVIQFYNTDIPKYHNNRLKLLRKNFNQIDI